MLLQGHWSLHWYLRGQQLASTSLKSKAQLCLDTRKIMAGPSNSIANWWLARHGSILARLEKARSQGNWGGMTWSVGCPSTDIRCQCRWLSCRRANNTCASVLDSKRATTVTLRFMHDGSTRTRLPGPSGSVLTLVTAGAPFEGHVNTISVLALSFSSLLALPRITWTPSSSGPSSSASSFPKPACTSSEDTKIYICDTPHVFASIAVYCKHSFIGVFVRALIFSCNSQSTSRWYTQHRWPLLIFFILSMSTLQSDATCIATRCNLVISPPISRPLRGSPRHTRSNVLPIVTSASFFLLT